MCDEFFDAKSSSWSVETSNTSIHQPKNRAKCCAPTVDGNKNFVFCDTFFRENRIGHISNRFCSWFEIRLLLFTYCIISCLGLHFTGLVVR